MFWMFRSRSVVEEMKPSTSGANKRVPPALEAGKLSAAAEAGRLPQPREMLI